MTELMDFDEVLRIYEPVIGLEVHVELSTASKMFCSCSTTFGAKPNTQTCPACLALPGALPVVNAQAVESAIRIGLALNCSIASRCRLSRKNYFYPDMTKNYQNSQYDEPICFNGWIDVDVDDTVIKVPIERAHIEEDTGKSVHIGGTTGRIEGAGYSLLDYNRCGLALVEIVTKPIIGTKGQAPAVGRAYVTLLRDIVRALGVSDGRMEQGSLRCDANISLMPIGSTTLGARTETKNVNSLRSIEKALRYEICRHGAILARGGTVKRETRHWNEDGGFTSPGRSKEEAEDYRCFQDPDLVPITVSSDWIDELRTTIPESPRLRQARLRQDWGFSDLEMRDVVAVDALELIEATIAAGTTAQAARKWWMSELMRQANAAVVNLDQLSITPVQVAEVQSLIDQGRINDNLARQVIEAVLAGEGSPAQIVADKRLELVQDTGILQSVVDQVLAANPDLVSRIRQGRIQAVGGLIGQVLTQVGGQADATQVRQLIVDTLESSA